MAIDARSLISSAILVLVQLWTAVPGLGAPTEAVPAQTEYQDWIARHARKELTSNVSLRGNSALRLVIIAIEREGEGGEGFMSSQITYYREVTVDGEIRGHTDFGMEGNSEFGGRGPQTAPLLTRLDQLQADLPDDGARLPPPSRRVLVQSAVGGKTVVRVYDRANLPDPILEIVRLTHCHFGVYVPDFKPQGGIDTRGYEQDGYLCLSPDGKQILFTGSHHPLQFWEPVTHELLQEIPGLGAESIAFSPDGRQALVSGRSASDVLDTRTWKSTRIKATGYSSQFTPDGRYALLQATRHPLKILDASTWQPVDHLPEVPEDTVRYFPAPKRARAVVQSMASVVALWDPGSRHEVARLGEDARLYGVAFSPDESLVAVVMEARDGDSRLPSGRVEIRRTENGQLVWKLRPKEERNADANDLRCLLWSPDGQYLFAGSSVFSLKTGRHRAQLSGSTRVNGLALLPDGSQLFAGDLEGKIRFWDFPDVMKRIKEFEKSLEPPSAP